MTLQDALKKVIWFLQNGESGQAASLCKAILNVAPSNFDALSLYGNASTEEGNLAEAIACYKKALQLRPNEPQVLNNLGVVLNYIKQHEDAIACYKKAIQLQPNYPEAHCNMGIALHALKLHKEAITSYKNALKLRPGNPDIHYNLGIALNDLERHEEAIASYNKSLQARPNDPDTHNNLGVALNSLEHYEDAILSFQKALQITPNNPEAHCNLGIALNALNRHEEAIPHYNNALQVRPNFADALYNSGVAFNHLKRSEEAIACYKKALKFCPNSHETWNNLGVALNDIKRHREAINSYKKSLEINPNNPDTHYNLGIALTHLKRHEDAINSYRIALELRPNYGNALIKLANQTSTICDWQNHTEQQLKIKSWISSNKEAFTPFDLLPISDDPAELLQNAKRFVEQEIEKPTHLKQHSTRDTASRIRLAYLSADFHDHATTHLMAELFEMHDREKFEVHAISFGPNKKDAMRRRLVIAFDEFHDVRYKTDLEVAKLIHDLGIQIAIDLKGYTGDCRPSILAYRPAPVQVSYLGYPGTMGTDFIDYILVDKFIAPFDQQRFFTETLVHLPNCYQVNDSKRKISPNTPTRKVCGLPESAFVFCCFNNNYKITPIIFDIWMRLLDKVPDSVLWLLKDNGSAEHNLRHEAGKRGINPDRLIFAPRLELPNHLARHKLADLFLDTFPVNAHTTASDALWAGLPILTYSGKSFASRVAGSLLHAIGLPEFITDSYEEYEMRALDLANNPEGLASYRRKLASHKNHSPLFDCKRFTQNIETAYQIMLNRLETYDQIKPFSVSDIHQHHDNLHQQT